METGNDSSPQGVDRHDEDAIVLPVGQLAGVEAHASEERVAQPGAQLPERAKVAAGDPRAGFDLDGRQWPKLLLPESEALELRYRRASTFEAFNEELRADSWDPSLVFLAEADGGVVGHLVSFLDENEGYVALLGVIEPWRGRGIAKALLRRAFAEISTRDRTQVKLGVDAQNPHGAVALYEGVGMTVERRLDIFELGTSESAA